MDNDEIARTLDAYAALQGLDNMRLAVTTARRGWATAGDVLNTQPHAEILKR